MLGIFTSTMYFIKYFQPPFVANAVISHILQMKDATFKVI